MSVPTIKHIRASVVRGGGGDYHDVDDGHWIDDHLATPMSAEYGLKWIEECLSPDDYWGYAQLRKDVPKGLLVTTGEHKATR